VFRILTNAIPVGAMMRELMNGASTIVDGRINGVKSLIAHHFRLVLVGAEPSGQAALPTG
jgi:hypothetical protein